VDKKYLLVTAFLAILIIAGAAVIFSQKAPAQNQSLASPSPTATIEATPEPTATASAKPIMQTDKLIIQDEVVGTGVVAAAGKKVTVNYTGTLTDGTKFDSSLNPGRTPFVFTLGAGEVIPGWDQGVAGMKVGGKRKLTIPSSLAYGPQGIPGAIPGGATLIFEVELLKVE
jgi:FKBP-type peptidyl-prolyl cis-trans isomerase